MSETKKPPAFYCPACGQKHRADLSKLIDVPGAALQLACAGCAIPLRVTLDDGGLPVCARSEPLEAPPAQAPAKEKDEQQSKKTVAPVRASRRKRPVSDAPKPGRDESAAGPEEEKKKKKQGPEAAPPDAPGHDAEKQDLDQEGEPREGEFRVGDAIGRYTVESVVGRGGASTVYSAFDPTTNRSVAVKVLSAGQPDLMRQRFLREIEVQANIRHQNIMPVFDRGEIEDGRPFFTMELLYTPWTLEEIVQRREQGSLARYHTLKDLASLETLIKDIFLPVVDGIYVANVENGVVHRDLKPENVLVDSRTLRPYVIDFGICHVLERKVGFGSKAVIPPTTEDEGIVGTPRYLAPEQVRGNVHSRTDVWGLGATLHFIIAGEPPLAGSTPISRAELNRRITALEETKEAAIAAGDDRKVDMCEEKLVRLTDPNLRTIDDLFKDARSSKYTELPASAPATLRAVVTKAMAASTSERYVNARQMGTDLQAWLAGGRVRALAEVGGKAAAVETARRAVRTHTVTFLWLLAGLLVGLGLARLLAKPGEAPPSTRIEDAQQDIELLTGTVQQLQDLAGDLTAVERNRLWSALDARAQHIRTRLLREPAGAQVDAVLGSLDYVRSRFMPPRIRIDVPENTGLEARDLVTNQPIKLVRGENKLPPGAYRVHIANRVQFPIEVPLRIRTQKQAQAVHAEPALATFTLPVEPSAIPRGLTLVLGGRILPRDLPFNPPSTAPVEVAAFFMDETEVTNAKYAQFLSSLPPEERKVRAPRTAFVPDPEQDGAPMIVRGNENVPVVGIRIRDAKAYAAWRGTRVGAVVRLPTEAEWVLAAGAGLGYALPNGAQGYGTDADFASPLRDAGSHKEDVSPFGVRGMFGNAREMVLPYMDDLPNGAVLVKGAGVGDDPDQGAIYIHRILPVGEQHPTTGFRCVQEIAPKGQ